MTDASKPKSSATSAAASLLIEDQSLHSEIELFYAERNRLRCLLAETEELLDKDFAQVLSSELVAAIRQNLDLQSVKDRVGQLFRNDETTRPCIVIVGQTKSGKSTFINELLGDRFVAQSAIPCTARVTRLTYSERVYIRIVDSQGVQLGDTIYPEKSFIDDGLTKLTGLDRENEELLSSMVEAGVRSEFLKHGIDVIDSPGLNENAALDALTMRTIDSFLPIILYVIDARDGVALAAEKDIQSIRASAPGVELFYLVNKMDVSPEDVPEGRTAADIEDELSRRAFEKLQRMKCIGADETPETCRRFFCLSSRAMAQHRRLAKRTAVRKAAPAAAAAEAAAAGVPKPNKWVQRFLQVQQRLAEFAAHQFRNLIVSTGSSLLALHCRTMDAVMSKANDIKASTMMRRKNLEYIRAMECRNHERSKKVISSHYSDFTIQAEKFLDRQGPILLGEAEAMQYSDRVMLQDQSEKSLSSAQIKERCIGEIQQFINNRIVNAYQDFLKDGAMSACFSELEDLKARVWDYEKEIEQTPSLSVLRASLVDDCDLVPMEIYSGGLQTVMRALSLSIRTVFRHPGVIFNKAVGDKAWKRYQAQSHLQKIDTDKLVDCLVNSMHHWLDKRHFEFLDKIRCSEQLVENAASLSELERQRIVHLSPKLAFMYTRCLAVVTAYQLRGYKLDKQIGSGAQGQVFTVKDPAGRTVMAAKSVKDVDAESLANISSEVFYSSVLRHPNLVRVEGVKLAEHRDEHDQTIWTLELYMEHLHSDVWHLMQHTQLPMQTRIWFGLQLAKALEFLHSSDLIHRDVKLQNVLVDKELKQVKLTDFGLIKSAGITGQSLVGTPIYLAPEMVTNSSYDTSADVYSLGIALWYLAEGSGRKHPDYVEVMPSVGAILLASSMNSRPNRLSSIPDDLWDLMERCWDQLPSKRPPAFEVAEALTYILTSL